MSPIRSTKFGFNSLFADKVETDNNFIAIDATHTANDTFEPGNGYKYLVFTSPGYLYVNRSGRVDIVAVGGGGGGGTGEVRPSPGAYYAGGGGGAGGLYETMAFTLPVGDYEISIGAGGASPGPDSTFNNQPGTNRNGSPGTPSYISGPGITTIIAYGGGGGGGSFDNPGYFAGNGSDGGSGGGAAGGPQVAGLGNSTTAAAPTTGNSIPEYFLGHKVQGHPGYYSPITIEAGGGGGAGANARFTVDGDIPGNNSRGGDGRSVWGDDPGIPPTYGTPGPTPGRYFAGGGGGGDISGSANGGVGGGGRGGDGYPSVVSDGTAGTVNTGGGGGGGSGTRGGYPGGSGIIILRYKI